jgi:anion-transporting  ArsA/GET3 family ATPase
VESEFQYPFPLLIIAGKGGVGKTVLTAALGTESAAHGRSTLVVELGGQRQLLPMLTDDLDGLPTPDSNGVVKVGDHLGWETLSPDRLLAGWLSGRSMGLIADRLENSGALSVIASSVPGIKDVLLLGHLRSIVESKRWDRIIVDGPASGRARELLRAPRQVAEAATEGPIYDQATRAHTLLTDTETTAVLLVTIAEETPVNETIETAFDIEDDPGIRLAGVVVNRVFPLFEPPAGFEHHPFGPTLRNRHRSNVAQIERLEAELPVPRIITAENPHGVVTPGHVHEVLGDAALVPPVEPGLVADMPTTDHIALEAALERDVVVTVGTGGVGKTTLGAAIALRAAEQGRSVALVTIDPAKRLADALGLDMLDDDLHDVAIEGTGRLQATMLDPGRTFERVVRTYADSSEHADRILASPLATQLTDSLSGMTEYMAVERLWELHNDPEIDLVVVDTPPSSDALAFLDAPTLLARLLDNRIYRLLVHGKRRSVINRALGGLVGQLVSTVGGTVVREAVDFFRSFEGVEEGFRERGDAMHDMLRSSHTSFIVVASPTGSSLGNAREFIGQLREAGVSPSLTLANRCTPEVAGAGRAKAAVQIIEHLRAKRSAERSNVAVYARETSMPMVLIDDLPEPVTTLDGIRTLSHALGPAS